MANISLPTNLADVKAEGNFELKPLGTYTVEVQKVEVKHSPGKEHPYLSMQYNITEPEEFAGGKFFDNVSMSPKALFKFKQLTLACNLDITDQFDTDDLLGNTVSLVIKYENKKDSAGNLVLKEDGTPEQRIAISTNKL